MSVQLGCLRLGFCAPFRSIRSQAVTQGCRKPLRLQRVNAQNNTSGTDDEDADSRLEELERGTRRRARGGTKTRPKSATADSPSTSQGMADWREGELLPRGWESMPTSQKATELWMGKRGALFWANKAAWASVFIVGGAWVFFRIIGPALGLYTLKNDLLSPPNL